MTARKPATKASTDNGFFHVANDMQDAICSHKFSLREKGIMDCLIRCTYGWGRKWTKPEVTQEFLALMSGICRQHVSSALKSLLDNQVILKEAGSYAINTLISEWKISKTGLAYLEVLALKCEPKRFKKTAESEPKRFKKTPDSEEARTETVHNVNQNGSNYEPNRFTSGPANPDEQGIVEGSKYRKYSKYNTPPHGPHQEKSDTQNVSDSGGCGGDVSTEQNGPLSWLPPADRNRYLAGNEQILQKLSPGGLSSTMRKAMNQFLSVRPPACCPAAPRLSVGMTWAQVLTGHLKVGVEETQEARASPGHGIKNPALMAISRANALLGDTIRKFETEFHPNESENPQ